MQVVKCCIILINFTTFFLFINCSGNTGADLIFNNNKEQENNNFNTLSDDIYLDDQDVSEGSGRGGGEVRDDLEASGSGLGPDDEDGDERELAHYNESSEKKTIDTQKFEESQYKDIETKKSDFIDGLKNNIESSRQPNNLKESEMESSNTSDVTINLQHKGRTSSFFAQPGVLAAIVGGAVVGLLCAILVVMFIVYRMRKKDEGSYALEEPRRSPATNSYPKIGVHANNREFYA